MYPTIWRVRLLLTSRVWEPEKDTRIWENVSGQVIGFAMLWRRQPNSPYIVLDSFAHPAFVSNNILKAMLEWGDKRAHEIVLEKKASITVYANGFSHKAFADDLRNTFGYALIPPNPDEYNIYFSKKLGDEISIPLLPEGYTIHPLRGDNEIESYQSLYGFAKVNPIHQKELLESDEYSHLVVISPEGEFVAYCECSICRAEWQSMNSRIGWIDYVETKPGQQRQGFGRVALIAGLAQLQEWGTETAMLVTINTNIAAVSLYDGVGFERVNISEPQRYEKRITFSKGEKHDR
jgi:ribosomal protein S18 acetylase RimI-like enzyme